MSFGIPMIHNVLEWKKTVDSKNEGAEDSVSNVQSIYLPSVRNMEDDAEEDRSTKKSTGSGKAERQQPNKTDGDLTDKAATSTGKASSVQSDNTDHKPEEEYSAEYDGSVTGQGEDDESGSFESQEDDARVPCDEEGATCSMSFNTKQENKDNGKQPLLGLVLTPTRELAVQVKHHIDAVAQFTGL